MKPKTSKRSSSNKQQQNNTSPPNRSRRLSNSSTGVLETQGKSSTKTSSCTESNCLDTNTSLCKASLLLKSQKVFKRDLLRCSDQRPSVLGSHILQTSRIRHESQQPQPTLNHGQSHRRRSLSADPYLRHTTSERIGPWPDLPAVRTTSAGNDSSNPMKASRNIKNPRVFSPKYYAALMENTVKFRYHTSSEMYINEYRKQKGYLLSTRADAKVLPRVLPIQPSDDDELSVTDILVDKACRAGGDALENDTTTTTERTMASTNDQLTESTIDLSSRQNALIKSTNSFTDHPNIPPSIPSLTKSINETHHMSNFSTVAFRNGHLRAIRHPNQHRHHQQQTIVLPPLNPSSLQYLNSMNSTDRYYSNIVRKPSVQNHQKFFLLEGRSKKSYVNKNRNPPRINSDSEIASRSQDYSDLQATGGPVLRTTQRTQALAVYQLPRQAATIVTSQNDLR
ncbi:unnamed protein product [Adineta ricciae]|uniref:Uncharacterized protein n=1 Tax=Adineta ricciae TaxID=249248 RepID=A0A813NV63_ADIRI|nr:unnamed protein product [Adineta ricciae]